MTTRKDNKEKTRSKIINISRTLFLEKGYENTTIREILAKADISTGSLYHFFKNKEEILLFGLKDALVKISRFTDMMAIGFNEPLLRYAFDIALETSEILKHKRLFNLFNAVNKNESVEDLVISLKVTSMKKILNDLNLQFTEDEIHARILVIHGASRSLMIAKSSNKLSLNIEEIYSLIIKIALSEFDISNDRIDEIIKITTETIQSGIFSRNLLEKLKS